MLGRQYSACSSGTCQPGTFPLSIASYAPRTKAEALNHWLRTSLSDSQLSDSQLGRTRTCTSIYRWIVPTPFSYWFDLAEQAGLLKLKVVHNSQITFHTVDCKSSYNHTSNAADQFYLGLNSAPTTVFPQVWVYVVWRKENWPAPRVNDWIRQHCLVEFEWDRSKSRGIFWYEIK